LAVIVARLRRLMGIPLGATINLLAKLKLISYTLPESPTRSVSMLTSSDYIHGIVEGLLPNNKMRTACLSLLADSVVQVHKSGNSAAVWSVTLASDKSFIRLNVGVIEACAIFHKTFHICLNKYLLSEAIKMYRVL
jgi:hypothetical protein